MNQYACAILLRHGQILLGRRAAHRRAYPNCWDVIGGRMEAGETLEAALTRELGEELGIVPTQYELVSQISDNNSVGRGDAIYSLFLVSEWRGGRPRMLGNEHSELGWFDFDTACSLPDLALTEYRALFRTLQERRF